MADQLTLGVIFEGYVNNTFGAALNNMRQVVSQTDKVTTRTKKLTSANTALNKQIGLVTGGLQRLGAAFKVTASYGLASTIIFGFVNALRAGGAEIINFDQALKNLQAITGATNAELAAMKNEISKIATATKFSTTEIAEGMVLLGQAGFSATEALDAINSVAQLATGTLTNLKTTTDLFTTTIRAFNMDTAQSGRVVDIMANAVNKSKLTVDKLRIAFNYIAASAAQAGMSLEQTAAAMMVLANNGLRASTIGTGLRQVLRRLIAPTSRMREALLAYGIEIKKIDPTVVGFKNTLLELRKVMVDQEKGVVDMQKAYSLFGLRGAQAITILTKSLLDNSYDEALQKTYEFGTAARMQAKQLEGLGAQSKRLVDRLKVMSIAMGDQGITGVIRVFIRTLSDAVVAFTKFVENGLGSAIIQMALFTTGTRAALSILRVLVLSVTAIGPALAGLSGTIGAIAFALGSFGTWATVAAVGIGAIATLIYRLTTAHEKYLEKLRQEQVEHDRVAHSIAVYQEALSEVYKREKEGNDVKREKENLILRLIEEHEDLSAAIIDAADSQEKLNKVLRDARIERELSSMRTAKEEINLLREKRIELAEDLKSKEAHLKRYGTVQKTALSKTFQWEKDQIKKVRDEYDLLGKDVENKLGDIAKKIVNFQKSGQGTLKGALLRTTQIFPAEADKELEKRLRDMVRKLWDVGKIEEIPAVIKKNYEAQIGDLAIMINVTEEKLRQLKKQGRETLQYDTKSMTDETIKIYSMKLDQARLKMRKDMAALEKEGQRTKRDREYQLEVEVIYNNLRKAREEISDLDKAAALRLDQMLRKLEDKKLRLKELRDIEADSLQSMKERYVELEQKVNSLQAKTGRLNDGDIAQAQAKQKLLEEEIKAEQEMLTLRKNIVRAVIETDKQVIASREALTDKKKEYADLLAGKHTKEETRAIQEQIKVIEGQFVRAQMAAIQALKEKNWVIDLGVSKIQLTRQQIEQMDADIIRLGTQLGSVDSSINKLRNTGTVFENIAESGFSRFCDAIGEVISGTESLGDAFARAGQAIVKEIMTVISKLLLLIALQKMAGMGSGNFSKIVGSFAGKQLGNMGFGPVDTGKSAIKAKSASNMASPFAGLVKGLSGMSAMTAGAGGQNGNIYNFHINATDAQSFANMLKSRPAQEMISQTMISKISHNAPVRGMMGGRGGRR